MKRHIYPFNSLLEFARTVDALPPDRPAGAGTSSSDDKHRPRDDWDGEMGYQGALTHALSGAQSDDPPTLTPVPLPATIAAQNETLNAPQWIESPVGAFPIVPNALAGLPTAMLALDHQPTSRPVIRVAVGVGHSAQVDAATIRWRGQAILSCVDALECAGYSVEIVACDTMGSHAHDDNGKPDAFTTYNTREPVEGSIEVTVKHAGEHWDPASVSFVLTHPAFTRRLAFRFAESRPELVVLTEGSYGIPRWDRHGYPDADVVFPGLRYESRSEHDTRAEVLETFARALA